MTELLTISGLYAGYGQTIIIEDVSLSLPRHGSMAVLGRNGVGKTTLLATIMGHTTWKAGRIDLAGRPIQKLPVHDRNALGIGYVPQTRDVFPSLSVEENLIVAQRPGRWTLERVYELFPRLYERRTNGGNQLSGGEQQMLSVGRSLMGNPSLLLLDEPLEGLAPVIVEALVAAFERLVRDESLSLVLVEQHARLALRMTQTAVVMSRGRIIYQGESQVLLDDHTLLSSLIVEH